MSFSRFLHENRGQFINHRQAPPPVVDVMIEEDPDPGRVSGGGGGVLRRRQRRVDHARYRHVRPTFQQSIWIAPLPYEEPEMRARRFSS